MTDRQGVGPGDLDECWCCGGLHDSLKKLCPDCDEDGCKHFGGECQSDHKPVLPDGGRLGVGKNNVDKTNGHGYNHECNERPTDDDQGYRCRQQRRRGDGNHPLPTRRRGDRLHDGQIRRRAVGARGQRGGPDRPGPDEAGRPSSQTDRVVTDGGSPGVEVLQGEYEDSYWHVENAPQPGFVIEEVGDNSTHWTYDWQEMGEPAPRDFERVSMLEVKLVVAMTDWDGEVLEAANEAHESIVNLKRAMADARDLDEEARQDIMMGNLDALPEVERFDPQEDSQP